jgi:hypothetical protein
MILMSYHQFPNLREMLQGGDLLQKLTQVVKSMDFRVREYNCRGV